MSFTVMSISALLTEAIQKGEFIKRLSNLRFVRNKVLNDVLGVGIMKWIVTKTIWAKANPKLKLENKSGVEKLKAIRFEMTKAEVAHIIAFLLQSLAAAFVVFIWGDKTLMWYLLIANIPLNMLPVLLQQQNKSRIDELLMHLNKQQEL